jgi:glycosyltransferase involved in cell wall biosynthesis
MTTIHPLKNLRPNLVFISEKYPPYSVGGAEISLSIAACKLCNDAKITIISYHSQPLPKVDRSLGYPVIFLPLRPFKKFSIATSIKVILRSLFGFSEKQLREFSFEKQVKRTDFNAIPGGASKDFVNVPNHFVIQLLRAVVVSLKPNHIIADNYRAIIYAAESGLASEYPSTSIIRDNRFFCNLDNSPASIKGVPCSTCQLECLDRKDVKQSIKHTHSHSFRTASLAKFKGIFTTSKYLSDKIRLTQPKAEITVISNPCDDQHFVDESIAGVAELPGNNIFIAGMIDSNKGQLRFLDYISQSTDSRLSKLTFHLAGRMSEVDAKGFQDVVHRCEKLGVRVKHYGFLSRENVYRLIRSCQLVLSTAVWQEPFGRAPLEAGMAWRPIVAFANGGLCESIIHGQTGFLIENMDYNSMKEAVITLIEDPDLRYSMGCSARQHIEQNYLPQHYAANFAKQLGI